MLLAVLAATSLLSWTPPQLPVTPTGQCVITQCGSSTNWEDPPPHVLACPGFDGDPVGPINVTLDCIGPGCDPIDCCGFVDLDEMALQLWPLSSCASMPPGESIAFQPPTAVFSNPTDCSYVIAGVYGRLRSVPSTATYSERVVPAWRGGAGWLAIFKDDGSCPSTTECYPVKVNSVDLNQDCIVDAQDAVVFTDYSPPNAYDPRGDLNMDGQVGVADSMILVAHMGHGCASPPVEGALRFYNTNRFTFPPNAPRWIGGSSTSGPPIPASVCADGADDATLISWAGTLVVGTIGDVELRIKEDPNGSDPDNYGSLTRAAIIGDSTVWRYAHPTQLTTNNLHGWVRIEAINTANNDDVLLQHLVRIYRPPVALIHGLWSNREAFRALADAMVASKQWTDELIHRHDYSRTNARSYETNALEARSAVASAINRAVARGRISAGRADVVAHSMGGILSRLFLQNGSEYEDDIHRLITLNTPHSGSQMADFLDTQPILEDALWLMRRNPFGGAVDDLKVQSEATLETLNGGSLNVNTAPSHVITAHATGTPTSGIAEVIAKYVAQLGLTFSGIFNGDLNDLIVGVTSQRGGLTGGRETFILGPWHSGTPPNIDAIANVQLLLNTDPTSTLAFSQTGFDPVELFPMPQLPPQPIAVVATALSGPAETVTITNPTDGAFANAGTNITVDVTGSAGITAIQLLAGNASIPLFTELQSTSTASFVYPLPIEAAGVVRLAALGYADSVAVVLDSVLVNVNVTASLDSIVLSPDDVFVSTGAQASVVATGYYSDDIERNVTETAGIVFSTIDSSIAVFDAPGRVVGMSTGQTLAIASFGGQLDTCAINVAGVITVDVPGPVPSDGKPPARGLYLSPGIPNPFRGTTTLQYVVPSDDHVELAVYDVSGQLVRTFVNKRMAPGTYSVVWDGRGNAGRRAGAGIYFVQLRIGSDIRETRRAVLLK